MQVTETLSEGLKRGFTVVLPVADLEARRTERLTSLGKTLRIPGFRPGKVPMPIVKQRYGAAVSAEILEESVTEAAQQVLTERGLRPALQPKLDMVTENPASLAADLEFKLEMELLPDIDLPDFAALELTRFKAEAPADKIDETLQNIAKGNHTLEPISAEALEARGHGAVSGEVVTIDFEGKIDGVLFEGGKADDAPVEIGGKDFIPGFAEQLEGAKPGESRTLNVTFPADYGKADLAGKAATFDVTVKSINTMTVLPVDDELAKKVGFDSLTALRELIAGRHQQELDNVSRIRLKKDLLDALANQASFPVPDTIAQQEFDQIWQQFEQARASNTQDEEDKGKDDETLRTEYRAIADRRVRLGLLLAEIARVNSITVSEQELNRAIYQKAMQYPGQEAQMLEFFKKYPQMTNSVRGPILEDKTVDFVLELAKVTDVVISVEDLVKDPANAATGAEQPMLVESAVAETAAEEAAAVESTSPEPDGADAPAA